MEVWKTAEGDEIPLDKMTDSHLKNVYTFLGRRLEANGFKDEIVHDVSEVEVPFSPDTDADGVAKFVDTVASLRFQADFDRSWMGKLQDEAARRGLSLN